MAEADRLSEAGDLAVADLVVAVGTLEAEVLVGLAEEILVVGALGEAGEEQGLEKQGLGIKRQGVGNRD